MAFRTFGPGPLDTAASAEGITRATLDNTLEGISAPDLAGMANWAKDAANQGAGLVKWRNAWPGLAVLPDAEARAVVRVIVAAIRGLVVDD